MDRYEYLPQSIVAYDKPGYDNTANLIHAASAEKSKDYYCPCCGKVLRVSCLDSKHKQTYFFIKMVIVQKKRDSNGFVKIGY